MSSPTGVSDETRSQDLVHANSQFVASMALADTTRPLRVERSTSHIRGGMAAAQAHCASSRLLRSPSPLGVSVAQCRA